MIRKTVIALAALATIGTAALAPTTASAFPKFHPHFHHHHHHGFFGWGWGPRVVTFAPAFSCYWVKTGWNRFVKVCN